jgi:signal transduction histidine kinase
MVKTVVRNLVSNAIKFTYANGNIGLNVEDRGIEIELTISDDGMGMSQHVLDKLFDLDTKHLIKGTNNETGTGLGLILCKEFIEKNKGSLKVESALGKGSTFRITFPKPVN